MPQNLIALADSAAPRAGRRTTGEGMDCGVRAAALALGDAGMEVVYAGTNG